MINVQIDEKILEEMLIDRLNELTADCNEVDIYSEYFQKMILSGFFNGAELDVKSLVDNIYINDTRVIWSDTDEWNRLDEFDRAGRLLVRREYAALITA